MVKVKNIPPYADKDFWLVAINKNEELNFWGSYQTESQAQIVAQKVGGVALPIRKEIYDD